MKTKLVFALCLAACLAKAQIITTIGGNGTENYSGNGGQATAADIDAPWSGVFDASGNYYFSDNGCVRKIATSGIITCVAGTPMTLGFSGDGGQATAADFNTNLGIAFDPTGNLYVADNQNARVRKVIMSTGIISTFAGNGTGGYSGDGGQATAAEFNGIYDVVSDASGNIYIADYGNHRIRKINTAGVVSTVVGNGTGGYSGDGGQASAAELHYPYDLCFDNNGNLYIADLGNYRIRKVNTAGIISTVAGNGTSGFSGDGGQATAAELNGATAISVDLAGNIFIADVSNYRVRKINGTGIISTYAGNGTSGFSGDGGQATAAEISNIGGIAINSLGSLYLSDRSNFRIRKISAVCQTNAGSNVINSTVCTGGITIGTPSISGLTYAWSPTTALSCTNCAQPTSTYTNTSTPEIYTLTVSGSGCTTATSTVQVSAVTFTISATIPSYTANTGIDIIAVGAYSANFTPDYYYWSITQCTATGGTITPAYSWNSGYINGTPSGTFTFPNTNTLTCNTYYHFLFNAGSYESCASAWAGGVVFQTTLPANAGTNGTVVNPGSCCAGTPYTVGTASVTNMSYSWAPANSSLSSYTVAQPSSTWSNTSTCEIYTVTVSYSTCTSATSTVQVCARAYSGGSCCRLASTDNGFNAMDIPRAFSVYPNPGNTNITVALYDLAEYVRIIDMQGRAVFETKNADAGELKLDISQYPKGIYFIMANISNRLEKQTLIVE